MARDARADNAGNRGAAPERDDHGLPRHRPHGRLAAHRPPLRHHDAAPPAALRPQAHHTRGRSHGHDRRPLGQKPGAQPARRPDALPQPGVHKGTGGALPRLRHRRAQPRRAGEQLRLDEGLHLPRLRTRGGQAHHRELHDGQGERAAAAQRHTSTSTRAASCSSAATTSGAT